jgi:hypothetical protein
MRNLLRMIILWALGGRYDAALATLSVTVAGQGADIAALKSRTAPVDADPAALDAYAAQTRSAV